MWVFWVPQAFALLIWTVFNWSSKLKERYQQTPLSLTVLAVLATLSSYMSWLSVQKIGPALSPMTLFLINLLLAAFFFTVTSFIVLTLWKAYLTKDLDQEIRELELKEDYLKERIHFLRWDVPRPYRREIKPDEKVLEKASYSKTLQDFIVEKGNARVRSLMLHEWGEDLVKMSLEEIDAVIQGLYLKIQKEEDKERLAQYRAKHALFSLEYLENSLKEKKDLATPKLQDDGEDLRDRHLHVQRDLEALRERKQAFLREKIVLKGR